jgi:hypothetical protein
MFAIVASFVQRQSLLRPGFIQLVAQPSIIPSDAVILSRRVRMTVVFQEP